MKPRHPLKRQPEKTYKPLLYSRRYGGVVKSPRGCWLQDGRRSVDGMVRRLDFTLNFRQIFLKVGVGFHFAEDGARKDAARINVGWIVAGDLFARFI